MTKGIVNLQPMIATKPTTISFSKLGSDETGYLSVAEVEKEIPFEPQRIYWVYDSPADVQRGGNASIKTIQVVVCISGNVDIELETPAGEQFNFHLSSKDQGLIIPELHWRRFKFSQDATLLCLCSEKYDETDYIRDIKRFRSY